MKKARVSTWRAKRQACHLCLLAALTLVVASTADARLAERTGEVPAAPARGPAAAPVQGPAAAPAWRDDPPETLWIFDADFEDLSGDNAGWQSHDMSGFPEQTNYWHKDTIRINGFAYLGDSTWWCGTYNDWWIQPRGYGNNWIQHLYREFPLSEWSDPGDTITFEWDQRFAMENDYDYGYVDFSRDYGASWTTLGIFANNGFAGHPGPSSDWDHVMHGHIFLELPPEFAGSNMLVRFRFESDEAYSSQDSYDNPPHHSVLDGAWQLDNFTLWVNDDVVWYDDCESPGDNGWVHHDLAPGGQTGVAFERAYAPETYRGHECGDDFGWMMAAVDPATGRMVDAQQSLLISPPIYVADAERIVARWNVWYDLPVGSEDVLWWSIARSDTSEGLSEEAHFGSAWYWWVRLSRLYDRPQWVTLEGEWSLPEDKDWAAVSCGLRNGEPMAPDEHTVGAFLERVRVGVATIDRRPQWTYLNENYGSLKRLEDVFGDGSSIDYTYVKIEDPDTIASARTVASDDGGLTWFSLGMEDCSGAEWRVRVPPEVLHPASEIHYYFEATDGLGNVSTLPADAPDETFEFSILPIHAGPEDPGILIVDKSRHVIPGDDREYRFASDEYVMEALEILGYEYDVYDAPVVDGEAYPTSGPDQPEAYAYYDTHIWVHGNALRNTLEEDDQSNLIAWLGGSSPEEPRSLLLCGNEIGYDLVEQGSDATEFFANWLGAVYVDRHPGPFYVDEPDTMIRVRDAGLGFMTHDDGVCWLRTACPEMQLLDEVDAIPGAAERVLEYVNGLGESHAAGVARTDSLLGYRVVYLPFDIALMNEGLNGVNGHYLNGIENRVDLLENIMEHFGREPTGSGTSVSDAQPFTTGLARAYPNPFNPTTTIEYSVAASCRVTLRVYDLAGRVVRTLVDGPVEAGRHAIRWDGSTDSGERAASGVYFVRMRTDGTFRAARKMVLLK